MSIWGLTLMFLIDTFCPASFVLNIDPSCNTENEPMLQRDKQDKTISLSMPKRAIVIANHQIYADWIYIWCLAYFAKAQGSLKIILKDSLKRLPVFGSVMTFFEFIFLKRKLAADKDTIVNNLTRSREANNPMWLLLFPEGTVISESTRKRSSDYAKKMDMQDNRYTLLPRSTGLKLCMETLGDNPEWLYDLTIGYQGVKANENPEDVYTIPSIFSTCRYPKQIHVHIRRFKISDLPKDDDAFAQWMFDRFVEKDQLMAHFYEHGKFPGECDAELPIVMKEPTPSFCLLWLSFVPCIPLIKLASSAIKSIL